MRLFASFAFAVGMTALASTARAEPPRIARLGYDARVDIAVTATGSVWLVAAELLKPQLVPEKCRWCYRRSNGDSALNSMDATVRGGLKWNDTKFADGLSNALAFVVMPAAGIGLPAAAAGFDRELHYAPIDSLLIAEATILAADLNQLVKFIFVRERPFVHALPHLPEGIQGLRDSPSDANLSFYSGHTNLAFALAASSGTVAFMRGYRLAPLVLGAQLVSAFTVGYLRIAADKHYLSDVMVGAVVGGLIGTLVPLLFHGPSSAAPVSASAPSTAQGLGLGSAPVQFTTTW